jgi:hypothetical protein
LAGRNRGCTSNVLDPIREGIWADESSENMHQSRPPALSPLRLLYCLSKLASLDAEVGYQLKQMSGTLEQSIQLRHRELFRNGKGIPNSEGQLRRGWKIDNRIWIVPGDFPTVPVKLRLFEISFQRRKL